jgi:hypothetical protein
MEYMPRRGSIPIRLTDKSPGLIVMLPLPHNVDAASGWCASKLNILVRQVID